MDDRRVEPPRAAVGDGNRHDSSVTRRQPRPSGAGHVPRWAYYVFLVRGAVALSLGVALLLAGSDLNRLTTFVAVYWIVAALLTLSWVSTHRAAPAGDSEWSPARPGWSRALPSCCGSCSTR